MVRSALRVVPICYCDNFDGPLDTRGHVSAKEIGPTGTSGRLLLFAQVEMLQQVSDGKHSPP